MRALDAKPLGEVFPLRPWKYHPEVPLALSLKRQHFLRPQLERDLVPPDKRINPVWRAATYLSPKDAGVETRGFLKVGYWY